MIIEPYFMPKPCQHCDNPPCTKVCPVNAIFKHEDGIALIDNERSIGCRFYVAACPYSARVFNWFEPRDAKKHKGVTYNIDANVPQKKEKNFESWQPFAHCGSHFNANQFGVGCCLCHFCNPCNEESIKMRSPGSPVGQWYLIFFNTTVRLK